MKNIYILPTDKPSFLYKRNDLKTYHLGDFDICNPDDKLRTNQNIYITSDDIIDHGDFVISMFNGDIEISKISMMVGCSHKGLERYKKIVLTTDQDLIKDGVQAIDEKFLEWFVKNPSCEWVEVVDGLYFDDVEWISCYKISIPKEDKFQSWDELIKEVGSEEELLRILKLPHIAPLVKEAMRSNCKNK